MYQYKAIVTDYEGLNEALSAYGGQGWRLASVTPDTWRFSSGKLGPIAPMPPEPSPESSESEMSASYYLLVFEREGEASVALAQESTAEALDYSDFSLPDY